MSKLPVETEEAELIVLEEVKYPVTKESINELLAEYKEIPDIDLEADEEIIAEQYQMVLKGHKRFVKYRNDIEKKRKLLKEPALKYGKEVDGLAKEFTAMLSTTEEKLKKQREKVEQEEQRKQEEHARKEQQRQKDIDEGINFFKDLPVQLIGTKSDTIKDVLDNLKVPTVETFQERTEEALNVFLDTKQKLETMLDYAIRMEQADKIAEEAAAKAAEEQAAKDKAAAAEREAFEEEKRKFREEQEQANREAMARQEELNRQEAEREAEELAKKQEEEAKAKAAADRELQAQREDEALNAMGAYDDHNLLLSAIITGLIPHVKWEVN